MITHSLVPPTPGPVGVAGLFGVNVGSLILWGIVMAIPMTIAAIIYAKYIGKKYTRFLLKMEKDGKDQCIRNLFMILLMM